MAATVPGEMLQELIDNPDYSRLLSKQEKHMSFYRHRLNTFQSWPFTERDGCAAERMAEAGFYCCGDDSEPDLVRCYVCRKELDGWEENDDPWKEHDSHTRGSCMFIKLGKKPDQLTIKDFYNLEAEKLAKIVGKVRDVQWKKRSDDVKSSRTALQKLIKASKK